MSDSAPILRRLNVSRETADRLTTYAGLLEKWNPKINLVSRASLADLWTRHILDSAQLLALAPQSGHWVDLGSGGGFPGLVVGCLAAEKAPGLQFTLIESDTRKAAFLRTVVRETGLSANIIAERAETVEPQNADIVSARALTWLTGLLQFAERHLKDDGLALFPKGQSWEKEVLDAREAWSFDYDRIRSETETGSFILRVRGASRV